MKAIHRKFSMPATILAATVLVGGNGAAAQTAAAIPPSISTPDKVESSLGSGNVGLTPAILRMWASLCPNPFSIGVVSMFDHAASVFVGLMLGGD